MIVNMVPRISFRSLKNADEKATWLQEATPKLKEIASSKNKSSVLLTLVSFTNNTKTLWKLYKVFVVSFSSVITCLIITVTFFRVNKKLRSCTMPLENTAQQIQHRRVYRIKADVSDLRSSPDFVASAYNGERWISPERSDCL